MAFDSEPWKPSYTSRCKYYWRSCSYDLGPLRHLWKRWLHPMTQALRRQWTHTQLHLNLRYLSRHKMAQLTWLFITRVSHHEWFIRFHFKIFTHSNNTRELFIEEIPASGISKCRDPEHYFYGLSGNWEWSLRTADYWRHHFELPLLHGHSPFHNVPIDPISPSEAPDLTTKIRDLSKQLSDTLTAAYGIWGKSTKRGGWLIAWASTTRSRYFKWKRISLLSEMSTTLYTSTR